MGTAAKCARFGSAVPSAAADWPARCDVTALGGGPAGSAAAATCGLTWFGIGWRAHAGRCPFRRLNRRWLLFPRDEFLDRAGGICSVLASVAAVFGLGLAGNGCNFIRFVARCDDRWGCRDNRAPEHLAVAECAGRAQQRKAGHRYH